jgi:aminoglycoside/choline kinase family phosphotransferase
MHRDFKIDNIVLNQDASGINYKVFEKLFQR